MMAQGDASKILTGKLSKKEKRGLMSLAAMIQQKLSAAADSDSDSDCDEPEEVQEQPDTIATSPLIAQEASPRSEVAQKLATPEPIHHIGEPAAGPVKGTDDSEMVLWCTKPPRLISYSVSYDNYLRTSSEKRSAQVSPPLLYTIAGSIANAWPGAHSTWFGLFLNHIIMLQLGAGPTYIGASHHIFLPFLSWFSHMHTPIIPNGNGMEWPVT
jgi:hypothetical protein